MGRYLLAIAVAAADAAPLAYWHRPGLSPYLTAAYIAATVVIIALAPGFGRTTFAAALALAPLTGSSYGMLLWTAYFAGRTVKSRSQMAALIALALGGLAAQFAARTLSPRPAPSVIVVFAVFVVLPLLVSRYLAQHERLVAALDEHNGQLRRERDLLAVQERMRERLRIARDMHDSLGRRLSIVSLQAAALEKSPAAQEQTVHLLATAAREALDELHALVGTLRADDETAARAPGIEALGDLVAQFKASGVDARLQQHAQPRPASTAVEQAAFRVVEEGLTNAAKHAPGQPVTVSLAWEPDALLLTITNQTGTKTSAPAHTASGHGLRGLSERTRLAGGFLDHRRSENGFRLFALFPVENAKQQTASPDERPAPNRRRTTTLKVAAVVSVLVLLPATILMGAR